MAHTLGIYDPDANTTIDLAATGTSGIYLRAYAPADPRFDVSSAASLYVDGSVPIYSRAQNVIEQIVVDIRGTSADDAIAKLRSIVQAISDARTLIVTRSPTTWKMLKFKPQGSTNDAYALIVGGRVDPPSNWLDAAWNSYEINNVTITIERAMWQKGHWPASAQVSTMYSGTSQAWAGSATYTNGGDVESYGDLLIGFGNPSATVAFSCGFASDLINDGTSTTHWGPHAASAGTLGTDTTSVAGTGSIQTNVAQVTFGTAAMTERVSLAKYPHGWFRVFVRAAVSTAPTSCGMRVILWGGYNASAKTGATVTVSSATYAWHDMGAFLLDARNQKRWYLGVDPARIAVEASRTSGANNLLIDTVHVMPLQGYTSLTSTRTTTVGMVATSAPPNPESSEVLDGGTIDWLPIVRRGALVIPRGPGRIVWLLRKTDGTGYASDLTVLLKTQERYLTARGAA